MDWNVGPIYSAIVIAVIILIYSKEYSAIRTPQNRLFRIALITTIFSMVALIISVYFSSNLEKYPIYVVEFFNVTSRILMTIVAPILFYYSVTIIWQQKEILLKWVYSTVWVYTIFAIMIISSPFTGIIYNVDGEGPLYKLMYAIPSFYIVLIIIMTFYMRKMLSGSLILVILSFPSLTMIFVIIEYFYPKLLISSTAVTASLVIIYLYIQNKKILQDDLTGTMNRRAFVQVVGMRLEEQQSFEIVLVSIDDFKNINNQYGEHIGDALLKDFAGYLMSIQPDTHVFRFSGDEFAVLLKDSYQRQIVQSIRLRLKQPWEVANMQITLGATTAVLSIPDVTASLPDTINVLEYCIQVEKNRQKGNVVVIGNDALQKVKRRHQIYECLKEVIQRKEIEAFYQPIYHPSSNSYISFEALARLNSSKLGIISPVEFISIAEEKGLINSLGQVLFEKVCETIKKLESEGIDFHRISINFSPYQMLDDNVVEEMGEIIDRLHVNPAHIHIEITESVVIDNFDNVKKIMAGFDELGIQFSLDDYGTGYSNLASIINLPFKNIKIDKSLLYQSAENEDTLIVIQALSKSFRQVGKRIVMEGIETEEHIKIAEEIGCDYLQGYYFAKPMPEKDLIDFLKTESKSV